MLLSWLWNSWKLRMSSDSIPSISPLSKIKYFCRLTQLSGSWSSNVTACMYQNVCLQSFIFWAAGKCQWSNRKLWQWSLASCHDKDRRSINRSINQEAETDVLKRREIFTPKTEQNKLERILCPGKFCSSNCNILISVTLWCGRIRNYFSQGWAWSGIVTGSGSETGSEPLKESSSYFLSFFFWIDTYNL